MLRLEVTPQREKQAVDKRVARVVRSQFKSILMGSRSESFRCPACLNVNTRICRPASTVMFTTSKRHAAVVVVVALGQVVAAMS